VQWMKTIKDLSKKLATSDQRFVTLWKSFKTVAKLLRNSEDDGRTWGEFIPLILELLQSFVKDGSGRVSRTLWLISVFLLCWFL
jgi:hypothetical protein